jgi:ankyrin repeat protein
MKPEMKPGSEWRMTQPEAMKTKKYLYGVEPLNGHDAWALFEACAAGDLSRVKALLAKDRRLVNAQHCYQFPIHMAVRAGHAVIVQLLLDRGADPGQSRYTYNSWDKLLLAARGRGHRKVESILERAMRRQFNYSPDFNALKDAIIARDPRRIGAVLRRRPGLARSSDALGNNALHFCVITRQLSLIERFIELGTPIDARRADGQTPVLLAVSGADYWHRATRGKSHPSLRNKWVMVGYLLARGASYDVSVAAAAGDQERVERLLRGDAGLAARLNPARVSPLSYAAGEGHTHIVRLLLERGADPNLPENLAPSGRALFEACSRNDLETAKLLLDHGANPNAGVDSCGCCLTICEVYHRGRVKPLQDLLRRHGAQSPPYIMSVEEMKQALHDGHAVVRDEEFCSYLLKKRDPGLIDLYVASRQALPNGIKSWYGVDYPGSPALVRKLLEHGLDPNRPDWLGKTFLHACAENGDRSIAAVFLEAGADLNARDLEFNETPLGAAMRSAGGEADPIKASRKRRMVEFLERRGAK